MRFLMTRPNFERLEMRLQPFADRLSFVLMEEDGSLSCDGQTIAEERAQPDLGLISNDLFSASYGQSYFGLMMRCPTLKWVQSVGAGYDIPVFGFLARNGTRMTTNHSQAVGMADYVIWGVLNHFQNGWTRREDQQARRWERHQAREMMGSRWLILGFGSIGQGVARRARGFGAHVTGVRRSAAPSPDADMVVSQDRLFDHLGETDVVVCCMPSNAGSVDIVDAAFLAAMKPGSVIVNVGRGTAIVEADLLAALDAGKPEHAVLDVFRTEPLPHDSRFWDHPRVTITPHNSGSTGGVVARTDDLIIENIRRYLAGEELINVLAAGQVLDGRVER